MNTEVSSNVIRVVALAGIRLLPGSSSSSSTLQSLVSSGHSGHPPLVGNHRSRILVHTQTRVVIIVFKVVLQVLLSELDLLRRQNVLILALSLALADCSVQLKLFLLEEAGCTSTIFFVHGLFATLDVISTLIRHEHAIE